MLRLKQLRKQCGRSQQDVANVMGVTQATLSGWENGKYEIDNASLIKLSELFNVSVDYLLGLEDINFKKIKEFFEDGDEQLLKLFKNANKQAQKTALYALKAGQHEKN